MSYAHSTSQLHFLLAAFTAKIILYRMYQSQIIIASWPDLLGIIVSSAEGISPSASVFIVMVYDMK